LAATIESVSPVVSDKVEYIVIDGASTDDTLQILNSDRGTVARWTSEPDNGIYDAFNKGVRAARGEWILFLGAGDLIYDRNSFQHALLTLESAAEEVQVAYGRVVTMSAVGKFVDEQNEPWDAMRIRWEGGRRVMPHHQGVLQRRQFLARHPFDQAYKIVADYKVFMQAAAHAPPLYIDAVIAKVVVGGVSTLPIRSWDAVLEIVKLNRELGFWWENVPHQVFYLLKSAVKSALSMVLPKRAAMHIIDIYRLLTGRRRKWT
jgi:glycosyltransferase involved in cell wall biosynthesis